MPYFIDSEHVPIRCVTERNRSGLAGTIITVVLACGHYLAGDHAREVYVDDEIECHQCACYSLTHEEWQLWKDSGLDVAEWVKVTPRQGDLL